MRYYFAAATKSFNCVSGEFPLFSGKKWSLTAIGIAVSNTI